MTLLPFPRGGRIPEFDQADRLRKSLKIAGISVNSMAATLGVARETVSSWMNGHTAPTRSVVILWAQLTEVDYDWLETGALPATPTPPRGGSTVPGMVQFVGPVGLEPTTRGLERMRFKGEPHHLQKGGIAA